MAKAVVDECYTYERVEDPCSPGRSPPKVGDGEQQSWTMDDSIRKVRCTTCVVKRNAT